MNKINIDLETGFPIQKKTFTFMQEAYTEAIKHLCLTFGDELILYGVELQGSERSEGAIVHNGELIPFKRCTDGAYIVIEETTESVEYQSGVIMQDYIKRVARCSAVETANSFLLSDLKRVGEKPQATEWENVVYLDGFENGGTGNMQSRIDESGKGLVVGMFVAQTYAVNQRDTYLIAQTSLRPKRRQPAAISCFSRFTTAQQSQNSLESITVFGYVETDGKILVERGVNGLTFNVYRKGFVSACIDLD